MRAGGERGREWSCMMQEECAAGIARIKPENARGMEVALDCGIWIAQCIGMET